MSMTVLHEKIKLEDAIQESVEDVKYYFWSFPGNAIGKIPKEMRKGEIRETFINWGENPSYKLAIVNQGGMFIVIVKEFQRLEEIKEAYHKLFKVNGILYVV